MFYGQRTWQDFLANGMLIGVGFITLYRPLVASFLIGLILGDPVTGTTIGASIDLMYLGHISAGGSLPGGSTFAGKIRQHKDKEGISILVDKVALHEKEKTISTYSCC